MTFYELKKDRTYGPNVRLISRGGKLVVEKTYRGKSLPVRMLGFILIFRERLIYSKLRGIEGIPHVLPAPDRLTLVTGFMGGENLKDASRVPEGTYFASLRDLISRMHDRGVIHLDLRNRRNYGIDDQGRPYLVDFATCLYIPWGGKARRLLETIDWMGFAKVKNKILPEALDGGEKELLALGERLSSLWLPTKFVRGLRGCAQFLRRGSRK